MQELDKDQSRIGNTVESKEGERRFLSSNKTDSRSPSLDYEHDILSDEAIINLIELGEFLLTICKRLASEGHKIENGIIQPLNNHGQPKKRSTN